MSKSKKGSGYERHICKILSRWYSSYMLKEERDDIFWRTSGSGARATVRMKNDTCTANSCGDIGALHIDGIPFIKLCNIELKRGYSQEKRNASISLLNSFDNMINKKNKLKPVLERWLLKAIDESILHKRKHPLIIFKRDRKASCIIMLASTFHMLNNNNLKKINACYGIISLGDFTFVILRLDDFLNQVCPKAFFTKVLRRRVTKTFKCDINT